MGQRVTNSQRLPEVKFGFFSCLEAHWMRIALTLKRMWLVVQNTSSHLLPPPSPPALISSTICHLAALAFCFFLPVDDSSRCSVCHCPFCWPTSMLSFRACNEESIRPLACCCGYTSALRELTSDKHNPRHD